MKLDGMAAAAKEQMSDPAAMSLSFEERLGLIVDRQWDLKESRGLRRRLQVARLRQQAAVEDIDFQSARGLDRPTLLSLAECRFIESRSNIIITGPTGVEKTYIACAIAQKACRLKYSVRYFGCGNLVSARYLRVRLLMGHQKPLGCLDDLQRPGRHSWTLERPADITERAI